MRYTECWIKESLRLFPPVPIIGRKKHNSFEVDGHLIDKGTSVLVSIRNAHRDE
ncbi:CYP4-like protein, partial [Leptotrombidium deliense]